MKNLIQIGANVGKTKNDPLWNTLTFFDKVVFVEPVDYLREELYKNCIEDYPYHNILIVDKAISNYNGKTVMHVPLKEQFNGDYSHWSSGLGSVNSNIIHAHIDKSKTQEITVECITLNTLLEDYNIEYIDTLIVDTEGHDYEILMDYNFIIKPFNLIFEHKHLDGPGDNSGPRTKKLLKKLSDIGYKIAKHDHENLYLELR